LPLRGPRIRQLALTTRSKRSDQRRSRQHCASRNHGTVRYVSGVLGVGPPQGTGLKFNQYSEFVQEFFNVFQCFSAFLVSGMAELTPGRDYRRAPLGTRVR